jgi:hypothetical protein
MICLDFNDKLIINTQEYLKLCDKSTYTWIEHFIISI